MEKINFVNGSDPALNATNLNKLQDNVEEAIEEVQTAVGGDTYPIGAIAPYGGETAPANWLICDGSAVSRTTYADLFSVIGTSFGAGDGSTTFNLPDLRSRIPLGKDSRDEDFDTIGETYGEKKHTLTIDEMPSHSHDVRVVGDGNGGGTTRSNYQLQIGSLGNLPSVATYTTGSSQPHNIVQPSVVTNYIIKAFQSAGVVGNVAQTYTESDYDTYSCNYINNMFNYSNDEQVIGTYVNGKPIYKKTITGMLNDAAIMQSNVDILIGAYGTVDMNGNSRILGYYELYNNLQYFVNVRLKSNKVYFACVSGGASYNTSNANITLIYTKTTD